jgi:RecA/RadA recombinase
MINQVREKIGVFYGCPDVMPGGKGQTFANSLVLKFRGGKKNKNEDTGETTNQLFHVKVEKSKVCPPDEQADFVIWLREHQGNLAGSTSEPKVVFEAALNEGVIEREKNSYQLNGAKFGSQKQVIAALTEDELLLNATRTRILDRMNERRLRYA